MSLFDGWAQSALAATTSIMLGVITRIVDVSNIIEGSIMALIGTVLSIVAGHYIRKLIYKIDPKFFDKYNKR
jgi:hypothetical protein